MVTFDSRQRYQKLDNNLVCTSAGTYTNCGGIAAILVKIEKIIAEKIEYSTENRDRWQGDPYSASDVPGAKLPDYLRDAVFTGAAQAFESFEISSNYRFVLIEAFVHPVDANPSRFKEVGYRAVEGWFADLINSSR